MVALREVKHGPALGGDGLARVGVMGLSWTHHVSMCKDCRWGFSVWGGVLLVVVM